MTLPIMLLEQNVPTLEMLFAGVSQENLHQETTTGKIVGNEAW